MHATPDSQRRAVDRVAGVLFPDVPKLASGSQEPQEGQPVVIQGFFMVFGRVLFLDLCPDFPAFKVSDNLRVKGRLADLPGTKTRSR
jgi:hypothetical protein